eukprot:jgi/Psemu1/325257/estExt_fgenesh1_pg.C_2190005
MSTRNTPLPSPSESTSLLPSLGMDDKHKDQFAAEHKTVIPKRQIWVLAMCFLIAAAASVSLDRFLLGSDQGTVAVATTHRAEAIHHHGRRDPRSDDSKPKPGDRVFLHISDTHADPYYDYRHYFEPSKQIARNPLLFSKSKPATTCGAHSETYASIVDHWNATSDPGRTCPCGHYGANPPFSILVSLARAIEDQNPEFVLWGGRFCLAQRARVQRRRIVLDRQECRQGYRFDPQHRRQGPHTPDPAPVGLGEQRRPAEVRATSTGLAGRIRNPPGRRGLADSRRIRNDVGFGRVLPAPPRQRVINEDHHRAQLQWLTDHAFVRGRSTDEPCNEFLINAHVPLGWLRTGKGHHKWTNLEKAVALEYSDEYRAVIDVHHQHIIAELYGHINKADVRLTHRKKSTDKNENTDHGKDPVSISAAGDPIGDIDENIGCDAKIVSFTVAGIARRGNNDPQFQRVILEPKDGVKQHGIRDIEVYSMKGNACFEPNAFTFAYTFRDLFQPDFDDGINVDTLLNFVENESVQRERIEQHLALSSMPYTKKSLKDPDFLAAVRSDQTGCDLAE